MTAGEQIAEAWRAHRKGSAAASRTPAAVDLLAQVQIRDPGRVAGAYPHELSGGMGQRVMIAMMLAPDPELLIADEPTSALDATVQAEILRLIEDLVSRRGMALILISHDLPLVSHFCDRVLVMYAGRIVEELPRRRPRPRQHPYTRGLLDCLPTLTHPQAAPARADARPARGVTPVVGRKSEAHSAIAPYDHDRSSRRPLRRRDAVKGVSFTVPRGASFGIVGESGSGKSTVLRALAGLNTDWTGRHAPRRQEAAPPSATSPFSAACRWCSRTPTARCIRARRSTARCPSRCWCTASATPKPASSAALAEVALPASSALPLSAPAFRRPAPARGDRPRADGRARGAAARRADQRPRCLRAGRGAEPARPTCRRSAASPTSWSATTSRWSRISAR